MKDPVFRSELNELNVCVCVFVRASLRSLGQNGRPDKTYREALRVEQDEDWSALRLTARL